MNKYSWTKKYAVSAQIAGEIIESLPARSAEDLLKAAKKKSSPIHNQFEWDDSLAAQQHRLHQARVMIKSLHIEVITKKNKIVTVNAFIKKADKSSFYVPIMEAEEDDIGAEEIRCLDQMKTFKAKWKNLSFARDVIAEINMAQVKAARKRA